MPRIFIAINLPEEIKQELAVCQEEIKERFPDESAGYIAKWVIPENLHITLLFIGEVKEGSVSVISEIIQKTIAGWKGFEIKIKRVCYGSPKANPPRLIWSELEKNNDLECLADIFKKEMLQAGILRIADERSFTGHITLARIKEWQFRKINPDEVPEINEELNQSFQAMSIDIMESKLKRGGSEYSLINSIKLMF